MTRVLRHLVDVYHTACWLRHHGPYHLRLRAERRLTLLRDAYRELSDRYAVRYSVTREAEDE